MKKTALFIANFIIGIFTLLMLLGSFGALLYLIGGNGSGKVVFVLFAISGLLLFSETIFKEADDTRSIRFFFFVVVPIAYILFYFVLDLALHRVLIMWFGMFISFHTGI